VKSRDAATALAGASGCAGVKHVPVEIERAEPVDVLFPKFWRILCVASWSSILSRLHRAS